MNFVPFGGPLQSFVCFLIPSYDLILKKNLEPLQHNERQKKKKKSKFKKFQEKVGPLCRKMVEVHFQVS